MTCLLMPSYHSIADLAKHGDHEPISPYKGRPALLCCGGGRQKTLCVTLTYVKITSSGVNCALKNSRGGKSRSGKVIKKGI